MKNVKRAKPSLMLTLALALGVVACADDAAESTERAPAATMSAASQPPIGTVAIVEPADGAEIEGSTVTVRLAVDGFPIVAAGDMTPNTGHHHLYLDSDLTPPGEPVPTVENRIVHMGDASDTFTFEGLEPGEHRLIAVVADGAHFPLQPWVVDTVTFVVR